MSIRKVSIRDLSRVAEIYVFNNRMNFYPIFKDKKFSFDELSVLSLADNYFKEDEIMKNIYVFEDEVIKGFIQVNEKELCKIYVDTFFQNEEVGKKLIEYAISEFEVDNLWVLEKNTRGISFYKRHGFYLTGEKKFEEDTTEYLLRMRREKKSMSEYTFETITRSDIDEVVEIYNSNINFLKNHLETQSISKEFILNEIKEMQSIGFESKIIKDKKGNIIGLCDFKVGQECYLSLLMLKAKKKRNGMDALIYKELEQRLKLEGTKSIRIDVVYDYEENVVAFWKKQGFEECEKIKLEWNGHKSNAIKMHKSI